MTQKEKIAMFIEKKGSITPMQAFSKLKITKLATRISEMKRDGTRIRTEIITQKKKSGVIRYARYTFEE